MNIYPVTDFGARGNGTYDDTSAISAALSCATGEHVRVVKPQPKPQAKTKSTKMLKQRRIKN
jgi:hypothetical protein